MKRLGLVLRAARVFVAPAAALVGCRGVVPTRLGVNEQLTILATATRIAWKLRKRPLGA
jgi:choline dehydrogenase-like flavoprotein